MHSMYKPLKLGPGRLGEVMDTRAMVRDVSGQEKR